jgi:hypothetical protein
VPNKIQLRVTEGLGAGANPDKSAESISEIDVG